MVLVSSHTSYADTLIPSITASWADEGYTARGIQNNVTYTVKSTHLKASVFFDLYTQMRENYRVPADGITCKNGARISVEELNKCIELLLEEIEQKKTEYTYFTVLKRSNFVFNNAHGALILKFKDYPLVLKIFIEKPDTILNPFIKDFEELFFYIIGGGINRYFSGFTRVENRERIQQALVANHMNQELTIPLKYIWLPAESSMWNRKITLVGTHMGNSDEIREIVVPYIYGIIAEYIPLKRSFSWLNGDDRAKALHISNTLNRTCHALCIDQNIPNYAETDAGQTAIVDTENFGILLGFEPGNYCFSNYPSFWFLCAAKLIKDGFKYLVQWH